MRRTSPARSALEGFAANLSVLDPAVARARPDPVLARTLARFRELLDGSFLWQEGAARNLQDPLTFRSTAPHPGGRARGCGPRRSSVLGHRAQLRPGQSAGLGGGGTHRLGGRVRGGGALGGAGLRARRARDVMLRRLRAQRQAAGHALVRPAHRPARRAGPTSGLSILAITAQSLAAEASTARPAGLLHPHEHGRRRGHRGPRVAPAPLRAPTGGDGRSGRRHHRHRAARRRPGRRRPRVVRRSALDRRGARPRPRRRSRRWPPATRRRRTSQVDAGEGVVAIELVVAAQAVDVRGSAPLGSGTAGAHERVREVVPVMRVGDAPPVDVEPVRALLRSGSRPEQPRSDVAASMQGFHRGASRPCPETARRAACAALLGLRIVSRLLHIGGGT